MDRNISDTCTMHWEIDYVHRQSGHTLYLDTLRQVSRGCPGALQRRKSADKRT